MQRGPVRRHAGADAVPSLGHVDLEEHAAAVVREPLPIDAYRELGKLAVQAQAGERPYRIAGQVDPGALGHRGAGPLDDRDRRTPFGQRPTGRQAGNAGTDDQHPNTVAPHRSDLPSREAPANYSLLPALTSRRGAEPVLRPPWITRETMPGRRRCGVGANKPLTSRNAFATTGSR